MKLVRKHPSRKHQPAAQHIAGGNEVFRVDQEGASHIMSDIDNVLSTPFLTLL